MRRVRLVLVTMPQATKFGTELCHGFTVGKPSNSEQQDM